MFAYDEQKRLEVALKCMKNKEDCLRELNSRFQRQRTNLDNCVVGVVGWHVPPEQSQELLQELPSAKKLWVQHRGSAYRDTNFKYTIVMKRAVHSLELRLSTERIARHSPNEVHKIFKQIVGQVQKLHEAELVHQDLKPRNILFTEQGGVLLCDLDAAMLMYDTSRRAAVRSRTVKKQGSSGYYPPEAMPIQAQPMS